MKLIYHPGARKEEREAAIRYRDEGPQLGRRFRDAVRPVILRALASPRQFPLSSEGTRCARVDTFPYAVHFVELNDAIYIVAVAHTSREPGYWHHRLSD